MDNEELTLKQFATESGLPERKLRRWAAELKDEGRAHQEERKGSLQPVWVATRADWQAAAAKVRKTGPKPGSKRSPGPSPR